MKRREFIYKSALATSTVALGPTVLANAKTISRNDTIQIGVIGTGDRGRGMIPFLNQLDAFNVVACCDVLDFRLKQGIDRTKGKVKGYKEYRRLLENKDVDAVLIATPFSTHAEIGSQALDAGKHVYGEKTLAKGYDGIDTLLGTARRSDRIFQTGHQYHSSRLYSYVVDMISSGKLGKIAAVECQWNRNGDWRRPVPRPELEKAINWRMYREFSGGLTAELCSHQIDFTNWILNSRPEKVMGIGGVDYWKDGRETYDNVHLIYDYPEGVRAKFTCLTNNARDDYQVKVLGDKGSVVLDYTQAWYYPEGHYERKTGDVDGVAGATKTWIEGKGIPLKVEHMDPSKQALVDFSESIKNNTQPLSGIETGAKTAVCVQMALDAMYQEQIVYWPAKFGI